MITRITNRTLDNRYLWQILLLLLMAIIFMLLCSGFCKADKSFLKLTITKRGNNTLEMHIIEFSIIYCLKWGPLNNKFKWYLYPRCIAYKCNIRWRKVCCFLLLFSFHLGMHWLWEAWRINVDAVLYLSSKRQALHSIFSFS